jgi:hypothetical protein
MLFDSPTTLSDALAHQLAKQVLPTSMSSYELERLAQEIRDRSFFSARTTYADYLSEAQRLTRQLVAPHTIVDPDTLAIRPAQPGETVNAALVRTRLQQFLKRLDYQPAEGEAGSLTDLSSDRRIDLIIDTQTKMSQGYAKWTADQDTDVLELYPADELYRQIITRVPREWSIRWNEARASLGSSTSASIAVSDDSGPFIALKNDPIWSAISRFGDPFPPFDYHSGMWVRDADPDEAESLGVLAHARPQPQTRDLNSSVSIPVPDLDPSLLSSLLTSLGSRATISSGQLHLQGTPRPERSEGSTPS